MAGGSHGEITGSEATKGIYFFLFNKATVLDTIQCVVIRYDLLFKSCIVSLYFVLFDFVQKNVICQKDVKGI